MSVHYSRVRWAPWRKRWWVRNLFSGDSGPYPTVEEALRIDRESWDAYMVTVREKQERIREYLLRASADEHEPSGLGWPEE